MSFFDSFREEAKQRDKEKDEARVAIEKTENKIREERAKAREKRSIVRKKIKFVDNIASNREEMKDQEKLEKVKQKQEEKIRKARAARSKQSGYQNTKKLVMIGALCAVVIALGCVVGYNIHASNVEKDYQTAVNSILAEDYERAVNKLNGIDVNDSKRLLKYSKLQANISSYNGKAKAFNDVLDEVKPVKNTDVEKQIEAAKSEAEKASEVQTVIANIKTDVINNNTEKECHAVQKQYDAIAERYQQLVDLSKCEQMEAAVEEVKNGTDIGKVITAIGELNIITLDSGDAIEKARLMYDKLSDIDKKVVINYKSLTKAEKTYNALVKEYKGKVAEEQKLAEEKAKEKEEREMKLNFTVYVSTHGNAEYYHAFPECEAIAGSSGVVTMTQRQAISKGYKYHPACCDWTFRIDD